MRSELAAFGEMASHLANPLVLIGLALLLFFGVHRALLRSGILPPVDRRTSGVIVQSLLRYGRTTASSAPPACSTDSGGADRASRFLRRSV